MPWRFRNSLVKALEPSSCAAALRGPKQRRPAAANASTTPITSGASGPMIVRPTFSAFASATRPVMSSEPTSTLRTRGSLAVPPLPGATRTSETLGDWAHFQASACSRPPEPTIRIFMRAESVTEVAHAGEDHRHAMLVGRRDDLVVALAAAGLHDGLDAVFGGDIDAVAEREEGVRGHGAALYGQAFVLRLERRDARGIDARHLPGAHADRHAFLREHDGVRLHVLAHAPREPQVRVLRRRGLERGHDLERIRLRERGIAALHQQAADD